MRFQVSFIAMVLGDTLGVLLCIPGLLKDITWLLIAGAAVLLTSTVQALIFYRCPQCGRFLGMRWTRPARCTKCNQQFDW